MHEYCLPCKLMLFDTAYLIARMIKVLYLKTNTAKTIFITLYNNQINCPGQICFAVLVNGFPYA